MGHYRERALVEIACNCKTLTCKCTPHSLFQTLTSLTCVLLHAQVCNVVSQHFFGDYGSVAAQFPPLHVPSAPKQHHHDRGTIFGNVPDPSFFSNFQMPFLSFEEIIVKDRDNSNGNTSEIVKVGDVLPHGNDFFKEFTRLESLRDDAVAVVFNESDLQTLERSDWVDEEDDVQQPLFSVFRITTDGRTPFAQERNSGEIIL